MRVHTTSPAGNIDYSFMCPACKDVHTLPVKRNTDGPRWSFDGNAEAPTFTPSVRYSIHYGRGTSKPPYICHLWVRAGKLDYCSDSTHGLAGQLVDMPDFPHDRWGS